MVVDFFSGYWLGLMLLIRLSNLEGLHMNKKLGVTLFISTVSYPSVQFYNGNDVVNFVLFARALWVHTYLLSYIDVPGGCQIVPRGIVVKSIATQDVCLFTFGDLFVLKELIWIYMLVNID
jgi:hypothetical protein